MKKTVITTACAIALCGLLASCAKNDSVVEANVPVPGDGTVVTGKFRRRTDGYESDFFRYRGKR